MRQLVKIFSVALVAGCQFFLLADGRCDQPNPMAIEIIQPDATWQPLLSESLDDWEPFTGVPHKSFSEPGFPPGTSDDGRTGTPVGMGDPFQIFQIEMLGGQPVLHISGRVYAGLSTKKAYQNYHLSLETRWGEKKWPPRENQKRDSGLLVHCNGPQGAFWNVWLQSLECQIQETDMGDFISIAGTSAQIKCEGGREGMPNYDPSAALQPVGAGTKHWGTSRSQNFERENDWNLVEVWALGDEVVFAVNGHVVNHLNRAKVGNQDSGQPLTSGRLQLQSEAAEVFYRNIQIRGIDKIPE